MNVFKINDKFVPFFFDCDYEANEQRSTLKNTEIVFIKSFLVTNIKALKIVKKFNANEEWYNGQ